MPSLSRVGRSRGSTNSPCAVIQRTDSGRDRMARLRRRKARLPRVVPTSTPKNPRRSRNGYWARPSASIGAKWMRQAGIELREHEPDQRVPPRRVIEHDDHRTVGQVRHGTFTRNAHGVEMAPNVSPGVRAKPAEEPGGPARQPGKEPLGPGAGVWRCVSMEPKIVSHDGDHTRCAGIPVFSQPVRCRSRAGSTSPSRSSVSAAIQPDIMTIGMPGPGMRGAARQVEPLDVRAAVGRLERAREPAVAGQAVDRAVEHAVAVVDVLRASASARP